MNIPAGMQVAFQGKADTVREITRLLAEHGVRCVTGALPGGG